MPKKKSQTEAYMHACLIVWRRIYGLCRVQRQLERLEKLSVDRLLDGRIVVSGTSWFLPLVWVS